MLELLLAALVGFFGAKLADDSIKAESTIQSYGQSVYQVFPRKDMAITATAFEVEAPSGKIYTLTNNHVCESSQDGKLYFKIDGKLYGAKILEQSTEHDLCLAQRLPNAEALQVADDAYVYGPAVTLGYPEGQPLSAVVGDLVGPHQIDMQAEVESADECQGERYRIETAMTMFGPMAVCVVSYDVIASTVTNAPGGSGSPLLNPDGEVVGVMFAYSSLSGWASFVPLSYVHKLLEGK